MEINTIRRKVGAVFFVVIFIVFNKSYAQDAENIHIDSLKYQFIQMNFELGTMANWIENNDSITMSYDFGLNAGVEYEVCYTSDFSLIGHGGMSLIRTKNEAGSIERRILSVHGKFGFKQRIYKDIYFYGGLAPMYNITQQEKISSTGLIDYEYVDSSMVGGWRNVKYLPDFNIGLYVGVDLNINNWSSIRIYGIRMHDYTSLNFTYSFAPAYIGRLRL